ncbi:hypothetical protein CYLTODRAFT_4091 [Cylindrobasidium torrendii FP15055 ss-10]|uniref:Zn(2)-C6 fungal-type domain-containing protein n=1 Tax=Cylindrobasidium torrendii FP15055 ss-10 TaxID=1314674 RepID=A0A0D7BW27_9AGAR|nr:hypothetical protein CYLTODRAFT_4091 [Cylindrobasidium torrendii FP15055 ss-10]
MQRKRPKYTRSKTGCLTCRVKKIKCDETKPGCIRCAHGQRECTWPETAAPPRKKQPARRHSEAFDDRATASSVSDESSPSLRALTPPHRLEPESTLLPPLMPPARRNTDSTVLQLPPVMAPEAEYRRPSLYVLLPHSSPYSVYTQKSTTQSEAPVWPAEL